jgi:hypothetical protein
VKDDADFTEPANKTSEARRLLTALDTRSELVKVMIKEANDELTALRDSIPDAGGLLVAVDQEHARRLCREVQDVSGERPALAISDGDEEGEDGGVGSEVICRFRASKARWIVAVGMVSEGVDIQRLKVLVYATNVTSALRFRQIVGRVVRTREREPLGSSHVWIPNDSRLVAHAEEIEDEVARALKEREKEKRKKTTDDDDKPPPPPPPPRFTPLGGEGEDRGVVDRGDTFSAEEIRKAEFIRGGAGLERFSPVDMARVMKMHELYEARDTAPPTEVVDVGRAVAKKRENVERLVKKFGFTAFGSEDKGASLKKAWTIFRRECNMKPYLKPSQVNDLEKLAHMEKVAESLLAEAKRLNAIKASQGG